METPTGVLRAYESSSKADRVNLYHVEPKNCLNINSENYQVVKEEPVEFEIDYNVANCVPPEINHKDDTEDRHHIKQEISPDTIPMKTELNTITRAIYLPPQNTIKQEYLEKYFSSTDSVVGVQQTTDDYSNLGCGSKTHAYEGVDYALDNIDEPLQSKNSCHSLHGLSFNVTEDVSRQGHLDVDRDEGKTIDIKVTCESPELSSISLEKQDSKPHIKRPESHSLQMFQCDQCDYVARKRQTFLRHVRAQRDPVTGLYICKTKYEECSASFSCAECDYTTKYKENLTSHVERMHEDNPTIYRCPQCEYSTKSKRYFSQHKLKKHNPAATVYQCKQCEYTSYWRYKITQHARQVHNENNIVYSCDLCDFTTKYTGNISKHKQQKHAEGIHHKCDHCDFYSTHKSYLAEHVRSLHSGAMLNCEHCTFTTKWRGSLLKHVEYLHGKDAEVFKCDQCEFSTTIKRELTLHFKLEHVYKCEMCDYTTKWKPKLTQHMSHKHNIGVEVYACSQCEYSTKWRSALLLHTRAKHDLGAEMYKCTACEYSTIRRYSLINHTRARHAENEELCRLVAMRKKVEPKVFRCDQCDYSNKSRHNCERHVLLKHNTEADVFKCVECKYETKYQGYLVQHFKRRHNKCEKDGESDPNLQFSMGKHEVFGALGIKETGSDDEVRIVGD